MNLVSPKHCTGDSTLSLRSMDTCLRRYDNKLSHSCAGRSLYLGLAPRIYHPTAFAALTWILTCAGMTAKGVLSASYLHRHNNGFSSALASASPLSRQASSCFQALSPPRQSGPTYNPPTILAATTGACLSTIARFCGYPIQRSLLASSPSRAESCWHQSRSGHRDRAGL